MSFAAASLEPVSTPDGPRRRGWLRYVLVALLVALAAGLLWRGWEWLAAPERFPLQAVRLEGRPQHTSEAELREAIAPHLVRGLLGLDVAAIRGSVQALPWVEYATVRRMWPGTLVVSIEERVPVVRWREGSLLSADGTVFSPPRATLPKDLPLLAGPEGSEQQVLERFRELEPQFARAGLALRGLLLDERRSWQAALADGVTVRLGAGDAEALVARFADVYPRVKALGRLQAVDLRYPNGFALAWAKDGAVALQ